MTVKVFHRIFTCVVLILSVFVSPEPVFAFSTYNFPLDSTNDTSDANLTDNICADAQNYCTLRAALEQSKPLTQAGHTVNILFYKLDSPATIVLHDHLPQNTDANLINDDPTKQITINGNGYMSLLINGNQDTTIEGLIFEDFHGYGIMIYFNGTDVIKNNVFIDNDPGIWVMGGNRNGDVHITGNYIGYNPYTESRDGNTNGINVNDDPGNLGDHILFIGGDSAENGNVIAGNGLSGIFINNENFHTQIVIRNNYIGMADDTTSAYNYKHGIEVENSQCPLVIGGDFLAHKNLIAGNKDVGIYIERSSVATIQGNTFSANAAGTAYIPNQYGDIRVFDSPYLMIGGDSPAYGNVIPQEISVESNAINNTSIMIKHNFLGISRSGFVFPKEADRDGIFAEKVTGYPEISFNTITNFRNGINILRDSSMVPILNNHIYNNSLLGIDLDNDGVTPNDDPPDADTGPNGLQNFPVISNVEVTPIGEAKQVMFDVSIASKPSTTYYIQVFSSPFCSPSGYGEGKQIFFSNPVTTDLNGYGVIEEITDFYPLHIIGPCLTATATEFDGDYYLGTSEFSEGVMAWQPEKLYLSLILK
jgi:parallel beta-helix repeat protein